MVMIGLKDCRDLIPVEELCSDPGVLAEHIVGARQGCKGAQAYVGEVADRGGNDIETRRGARGLENTGGNMEGRWRCWWFRWGETLLGTMGA